MRVPVLRVTLGPLLSTAAGCGYETTAPSPSFQDGLWTASGSPSAVLRLAPDQLLTTNNRAPATAVTTPSAELFVPGGIAFAADGAMWIASTTDSVLIAFAPGAVPTSGSAAARTVIRRNGGSLSAPTGLAFDSQRRLWVANFWNGTLVRFDPAQLAAGGAPVPAVVLSGPGHPTALAFDAAGSLWVADRRAHTIAKYAATQLATSGSPAPAVVLSATANSLMNPNGLAFDASGNLWVANTGSQNLAAFSPAQLAATGSPAPHIVLSPNGDSLSIPVGLAFDGEGNLWVVGGGGALTKYAAASLGASGAPEPSARLDVAGHTLLWSMAFWPRPAGLPGCR